MKSELRLLAENRLPRWVIQIAKRAVKKIFVIRGMKRYTGKYLYNPRLPTVVVVSHEASQTGAPILALNICHEMSKEANVIAMLMSGGSLIKGFRENAIAVLQPKQGPAFDKLLTKEIRRLVDKDWPEYAIVNSIVSSSYIQPLRKSGIPVLTLIHEFSAYIRPIDLLSNVGLWSNRLIFSSKLTSDDLVNVNPQLKSAKKEILPQGRCNELIVSTEENSQENVVDDATKYLEGLNSDEILILGAGQIQPRKGIDLFVSVAHHMKENYPNQNIKFAWIGDGYDPINDFNVSLWIKDQIERSGLRNQLRILKCSHEYKRLMRRCNIFLMTSRLDPLPNVAIDAMHEAKPVFCFENATGLESLFKTDSLLKTNLIIPYLNTQEMSSKAVSLLQDKDLLSEISKVSAKRAIEWFDMGKYVKRLKEIGSEVKSEESSLREDAQKILKRGIIDMEYSLGLGSKNNIFNTEHYLRSWQTGVGPRKPFPSFHPGIYRERAMSKQNKKDPLTHYINNGEPEGPWNTRLIMKTEDKSLNIDKKIALHIHVHYPELLDEMLKAISLNQTSPDIYITCTNQAVANFAKNSINERGLILKKIILTPNKGRDIGPLLTCLGKELEEKYEIYGHIHTKKSVHIAKHQSHSWRTFLIENLIGNKENHMMDFIISAMIEDKTIGLVFPSDPHCPGWDANYRQARIMADKLNIQSLVHEFNFPIGTMFWARKNALSPLYSMNLGWDDYPAEPIGYDGTLLHSIERLIPFIVESQGFGYSMTNIPKITR